ncbi:Kiwa anti-phage protein KwaB-like domain-containing protein [Blautia luti]
MKIADKIENINLINNVDKIREYVERSNIRYAKKMMQISNFPII